MKRILFLIASAFIISCGSNNHISEINEITGVTATKYANTITVEDLRTHLFNIASDEFEGRNTGELGHTRAAEYLKNFYINSNINSPFEDDNYYQIIPTEHLSPNLNPSENVLAFIEGSEKPEEIIVISAHLDHLGVRYGEIYNGADDNGSGTVAILKIAEAFQKAKESENGPKRSILFLHVTGEEKGLLGSKYYVNNPIFPLKNTITNLNIDMIGRVDDAHEGNPNYVYLIGSDKLSTELHQISEDINAKFTTMMKIQIDFITDLITTILLKIISL